MAQDLDFDIEIRVCPIVREKNGLALSSRNSYLTAEDREQATVLYAALTSACEAVAKGETNAKKIKRLMKRKMGEHFKVEYEYARIVDPQTMVSIDKIEGKVLAAVAAQVGKTRLIDNMYLVPGEDKCGE
jgi:pantoate--beta-alanine ligase